MRKLTIILLALVMAFAGVAYGAGQWYLFQFDALSVLGNAYAIAPGVPSQQFLPNSVIYTGVDTDTSLVVYSENDNGVTTTNVAVTLTTVTLVNTTATAIATAGEIMYVFTGQTSDPNSGTFIWAGEVSSTGASATRGTELVVRTASDASGIVASGATVFFAVDRSGDLAFGLEVNADPTLFQRGGNNLGSPATDTTSYGLGASFYPLNYVGKSGKDQIFRVQSDGTLTTTVLHEVTGVYEKVK